MSIDKIACGGTVTVESGESSGNESARVSFLKKRYESILSDEKDKFLVVDPSKSGKLSSRSRSYSAESVDAEVFTAEDVSARVKQAKSLFVQIDKDQVAKQLNFRRLSQPTPLSSTSYVSEEDRKAISVPNAIGKGADQNNNASVTAYNNPLESFRGTVNNRNEVTTLDSKSNESGVATRYSVPIRSTARRRLVRESFALKRKAGLWQDHAVLLNSHIDVVSEDFDSDGPESVSDISVGREEFVVSDDKASVDVEVGGEDVFSDDEEIENDTEYYNKEPQIESSNEMLSTPEARELQVECGYVEIAALPSVEDDIRTEEESHPNGKRRVSFDTKPIKMYFTYTPEEYGRLDPFLDPVSASAEFELEKRIEKMNIFEVVINKGTGGLGIRIIGFGVGASSGCEKLGIFIKVVTAGGAVERDGRIFVGDQLIEVNDTSLIGVTQAYASDVLRATSGQVRFLIGRMVDESCNDIRELLGLPLIEPAADTTVTIDSEQADDTMTFETSDYVSDEITAGTTDDRRRTSVPTRPVAQPPTSFDADNETLTLLNAIAKCKQDKASLIDELELLRLEATLALRNSGDRNVHFEQDYIQSKNALCELMVEHSRLADEKDTAWNMKRRLKETQDRLSMEMQVLERRLGEVERASDVVKRRKLELDQQLSKQEILYKELTDNNDALLEILSDLELAIKMAALESKLGAVSSSSEGTIGDRNSRHGDVGDVSHL